MALTCAPKGLQMLELKPPQSSTSLTSPPLFSNGFVPSRCFTLRLGKRSELFRLREFQARRPAKVSCDARSDGFPEEEMLKKNKDIAQLIGVSHDFDKRGRKDSLAVSKQRREMDFVRQLMPSKLGYLEPNLLGIPVEQSDWPEMNEIENINIEQKANSVDIPLSLRIIKRKQKWQEGFVDSGDPVACSVKKAFSSVVFMVRELHSNALEIRESLYSEDLHEVMNKVQGEMNSTFSWMFQQVFSRTPTLMVYVMIVLGNFTVNSMAQNVVLAAMQSPGYTYGTVGETISLPEVDQESRRKIDSSASVNCPRVSPDVVEEDLSPLEMTDGEVGLWKSVLEEAVKIQEESQYEVLDQQIKQQLVSPITVEVEPEDRQQYYRTDLLYQMGIAKEPNNPLLLLNYAQFLCLVTKDFDRAEECFKRAIQVESPDAEALSQYADFLWKVRNDLWGAEEGYEQAMSEEPDNTYHSSKYANFLWSTGGEETCYPLSA